MPMHIFLMSVFPEARQDVEAGIEDMLNNNQDPAEAVKGIADKINKAIEDYNVVSSCSPITIIQIYAHVFGIINIPIFGIFLLRSVTGR